MRYWISSEVKSRSLRKFLPERLGAMGDLLGSTCVQCGLIVDPTAGATQLWPGPLAAQKRFVRRG